MFRIYLCFALMIFLVFAPKFSSYNPSMSDFLSFYLAPNSNHFFGTDMLGRDLFSRVLYALRNSIFIGVCASSLALVFALFYLLLARMFFYNFFMRILDLFLALPSLLLMMFFQSFIEGSFISMIFIIALSHYAFIAKLFESELRALEKLEFYEAALVLGSSKIRAFFKELLPPCFSLLFLLFVLNIIHAISTEATLSFFGLGLPFDIPSLGNILNDASKAIFIGAWWVIVFPLLALLMLILLLLWLSNFLQKYWGIHL